MNNFHGLPPLKRFRLLQQQQQQQQQRTDEVNGVGASPLPAKKRKETRDSAFFSLDPTPPFSASTSGIYSLPAKKRVWALRPDFNPDKPISPFDLNVEYKPSPNQEPPETAAINPEKSDLCNEQTQLDEREDVNVDGGCDEDDGVLCAVCQSTDGDPSDPIVFCDGCNLMVHATCYGNPLVKGIPEGDWFCNQCLAKDTNRSFNCCLCPVEDGAMKPTSNGKWAHIVCALLVPEVFFDDPEGREGINCSKVPQKRYMETCYICDSVKGCAIVCSELKCPLAFHVTCGLNEDLCIEYRQGKKTGTIVAGFCKHHSQMWIKQQDTGKFKIVSADCCK